MVTAAVLAGGVTMAGTSLFRAVPARAACDTVYPFCGTTVPDYHTVCGFKVTNVIYVYFQSHGGQSGLGCPTGNTAGTPGGAGVYNDFGTRATIVAKTSG